MRLAWQAIVGFLRNECGPTATEYAVLLGLLTAVIVPAVSVVGYRTYSTANTVSTAQAAAAGVDVTDPAAVERFRAERRTQWWRIAGVIAAVAVAVTGTGVSIYILSDRTAKRMEQNAIQKKVRDSTDELRVEAAMSKIQSGMFVVPDAVVSGVPLSDSVTARAVRPPVVPRGRPNLSSSTHTPLPDLPPGPPKRQAGESHLDYLRRLQKQSRPS